MDAMTSASWLVNLLKANMPCARDAIGHIKALSVLWSTFQKLCLPSCMILKLSVQLSLLIVVIIHSIREAFSFFFTCLTVIYLKSYLSARFQPSRWHMHSQLKFKVFLFGFVTRQLLLSLSIFNSSNYIGLKTRKVQRTEIWCSISQILVFYPLLTTET